MSQNIQQILAKRQETHGSFITHANIAQRLKTTIHSEQGCSRLTDSQKESLEMIMHKVARILAGDPNVQDHWDDIAGYATLVSNQLEPKVSKNVNPI